MRGSRDLSCPVENREYITFHHNFRRWCPYGLVQFCRINKDGLENIQNTPTSQLSSLDIDATTCTCVAIDTCLEKRDYLIFIFAHFYQFCPYGQVQCCRDIEDKTPDQRTRSQPSTTTTTTTSTTTTTTTTATTTATTGIDEDDIFERGYKCFVLDSGKFVCTTTTTTTTEITTTTRTTTSASTTTTTSLDVEDLNNRGYKFNVKDFIARGYKCVLVQDVPEYALADDVEVICDDGNCFGCVLRSERKEKLKPKTVDEMKALGYRCIFTRQKIIFDI